MSQRMPTRQERKAIFKAAGRPFEPLYGGRSLQAPLNVVLGRIEEINLRERQAKKGSGSGSV